MKREREAFAVFPIILLLLLAPIGVYANPIPTPTIMMTEEYINALIYPVGGEYWAYVYCRYPFRNIGYSEVAMKFPVPPDCMDVSVFVDNVPVYWSWSGEKYSTEIGEMEEPFAATQQGSSAMPHKRNPIQCEQLCGLARLMRSYTIPAIENIVLWHERDISHSSVERVIIPDAFTLADYMLTKLNSILSGITIHTDKMMKNIEMSRGLIFSQRLLLKLIKSGVPRAKAHLMIQGKVMSTLRKGEDFMKQVVKDGEIRRYISLEEIQALFDLDVYIRYVDYIYKRVFSKKKK